MHTLLEGHSVRLEVDPSQDKYDKYGRLLAYVHRDDGLFINEAMMSDGYAYEYTYIVPYLYQKEFIQTEHAARAASRGLWSAATCDGKL
jgi:micrococcal nuclease